MSQKKKVLTISSIYPSIDQLYRGIFVKEQAFLLAEKYEIRVLVLARWFMEVFRCSFDKIAPYQTDRILAYIFPPYQGYNVMACLQKKFLLYMGERYFRRLLKEWAKPDIIHAHLAYPAGYLAVELGKKYQIPVVITEHSNPNKYLIRQKCVMQAAQEAYTNSSVIIAVSPFLEKEIHQFNPSTTIKIIGNVIDDQKFFHVEKVNKNPQKTVFLAVSTLENGKGIDILIKAGIELAKTNVLDFLIIIGGDGPKRKELERMARQSQIAEKCIFLGKLSHPEGVRQAMQQCDVFVLPSLHETFGVVLAEAMACGKPVISTRCGGAEYVTDEQTGMLINPGNVDELAKAMRVMIKNKSAYQSDTIRSYILGRFGKDAFIHQVSEIYSSLFSLEDNEWCQK